MDVNKLRDMIQSFEHSVNVDDFEKKNYSNYKLIPIELLVPADWNYKTNDEFKSEQLRNNIKRNGQIENVHVRDLDTGYFEVVNGNHRLPELKAVGRKFVLCYDHGKITLKEAKRIAIETNETRFDTDQDKLKEILKELNDQFGEDDLKMTLPYVENEFDELLGKFDSIELDEVSDDGFEAPSAPPQNPITKRGDLYELNNHRILCGDSTKEDDFNKLMNGKIATMCFTDPPYNVEYAKFNKETRKTGKDWTDLYCNEWDDKFTDEDYLQFLIDFLGNVKKNLIEYGHYYVFYASQYHTTVLQAFAANNISIDKIPLIWKKQVAPPTYARFMRIYEPFIFGGKDASTGSKSWFGPNNEKNVWEISREHNGNYIHPTQKPVELPARAIRNSSRKGDIVVEPFCGSASTLIASEQLERKCYAMEYEPGFVDVEVKRYIKYCKENKIECIVKKNGSVVNNSEYLNEEN